MEESKDVWDKVCQHRTALGDVDGATYQHDSCNGTITNQTAQRRITGWSPFSQGGVDVADMNLYIGPLGSGGLYCP